MANGNAQGIDLSHYQGTVDWLLWQSAEDGTVKGVTTPVDLDELNGPLSVLMALAKQ